MQPNNCKENKASKKDINTMKTTRFPLVFGDRPILWPPKNLKL